VIDAAWIDERDDAAAAAPLWELLAALTGVDVAARSPTKPRPEGRQRALAGKVQRVMNTPV
jgi:hypothetical protein